MTFGKLIPLPNTADVPEITVFMETSIPVFAIGLGYQIAERFELQGTLAYGRSDIIEDVGVGFAGIPLGKNKVTDAENIQYGAGLVYYFLPGRVAPFIAAGAGALTLKTAEMGSSTKLLLEYGAGLRVDFSGRLSAILDVKDSVSFFNYPLDFDVFFVDVYTQDFLKSQHRLGLRLCLRYSI